MAKLKTRKGTKYPFKQLEKVGDKFTIKNAIKKNLSASYAMYKAKNNIACSFAEYDNQTIVVTRIA